MKEDDEKIGCTRALRKVWSQVPPIFGGRYVIALVKKETGKNYMDTTVMRKMRYLRNREEINYECINKEKSLYRKIL